MAIQSFRQAGLPNTNTNFTPPADFSNTATGTYTGYKYVTFTGNGTLTVTTAGLADILVVGGGGGGGKCGDTNRTGGTRSAGGAGGYLETQLFLDAGSYTVTVGSGGAGSTSFASYASDGTHSKIDTIVCPGGGGGWSGFNADNTTAYSGRAGGSGSGSVRGASAGAGLYSNSYGNAGGVGSLNGAGGGAGGAGSGSTPGPGLASSITGSSVTRAVGGNFASAGAANTGTGGGGGASSKANGYNGGSGIVIVRVAV